MNNARATGKPKISCIICAFNEAPRIAAGLAEVCMHPLIDEVIVVDDGSTDGTADVVGRFPTVRLLTHPSNQGKSAAMATAVAAARHDRLLLLDADLKGLTGEDIAALIMPVVAGDADISISLRRNSLFIFRILGMDFVSGERVVPKRLLAEVLDEMSALPRFGIEVFMNGRLIEQQMSIAVTHWPRVTQARKTEKLGWWRGVRAEWRMFSDLLRVIYPLAMLSQTYRMLGLRVHHAGAARFMVRLMQRRYQPSESASVPRA